MVATDLYIFIMITYVFERLRTFPVFLTMAGLNTLAFVHVPDPLFCHFFSRHLHGFRLDREPAGPPHAVARAHSDVKNGFDLFAIQPLVRQA